MNEITSFDLEDVRDADILLVNYSKPSIGTSMEVFYAHQQGKHIVAFTSIPEKEWSPWMIKFTTRIVKSLDEAIEYIEKHFGGNHEKT